MSIVAILALSLAGTLQSATEIACYAEQPTPTVTQPLWDGFVVKVGLADDAKDNPEEACIIEVRDKNGRAVYTSRGYHTRLHPGTGRDIDNDGKPDAVLGTDTAGGNSCCFMYAVLSFSPTPHVVANLEPAAFTFDTDNTRRTLIWTTQSFYGLGASMADSPTVEFVHQFRSGQLVDVTAEYCAPMLSGKFEERGNLGFTLTHLTPSAKALSRSGANAYEVQETRVSALSFILQSLYCNQIDAAAQVITEVWPPAEQAELRKKIKDEVSRRWPGTARRMAN